MRTNLKKWSGMLAMSTVVISGMADTRSEFSDPPLKYATRPLWFWANTPATAEGVQEQMQKARDLSGFGGFGILPFKKGFKPEYLSEDYFAVYGAALDKARELGMTMCVYDEYGFPSGSAGARGGDDVQRFKLKHPGHTIKRLDKVEKELTGPTTYSAPIPANGQLMAMVAMEVSSKKRINLTDQVQNGAIHWEVPEGRWKVMSFMNMPTENALCDYLDPEACQLFVDMTHQEYYNRFKEHFGTTIDGTFFDEPTIYHEGGRCWTGAYNEKFIAKHGFDPAPYYPALWYDIGEETEAARNYLFGFRAELYSQAFPKVIQDWATAHGITATGHQDQEEIVNQTAISGDLMLLFKHQDIPGIDKIGGRAAERVYKVISSAAYNWDKALVMSETYGAMNIGWDEIYTIAMEQYTKGINQLIPHAMWYSTAHVRYKPELSWRTPKYADKLPQYNKYMGRLNVLLQNHGRHVADIAMLYPVSTMQAEHYMEGPLGQYHGGVAIPELDYVEVSGLLTDLIGRDFTFLHPEVLNEKCTVAGDTLKLSNPVNYEDYKVVILPGHTTINWENLKKIKAFYDQGGKVLATGTLPSKSAEFGHDAEVVAAIQAMFPDVTKADPAEPFTASSTWAGYEPKKAFDGLADTRWNAADKTQGDQWLQVSFDEERPVNQVDVHELFDRTTAYRIQYMKDGRWMDWTRGESLGKKSLRLDKVVTSSVRLCIDKVQGRDSVSISELSVLLDGKVQEAFSSPAVTTTNGNGGMTVFLAKPSAKSLRQALDSMIETYDVEFEAGEELRYIHKVQGGKEIYFFANLNEHPVRTWVELRGALTPQLWNPHTGAITPAEYTQMEKGGSTVTRVKLDLDRVDSLFVVSSH